ncbi:TPA: hypothetical protein ACH3X1_012698 [Trebouxia sp. C0004]
MQDAKKRLKQEHLKYLKQQAFIEQLQGLFNAVFACIDSSDTDKAAEKALRREGFHCASQVYVAACDHLQVAKCAQRLQLPVLQLPSCSKATNPLASGCTSHLLGITGDELLATHIPDLSLAQKGSKALLPEIESRIKAQAQWLAEVCEHQGPVSSLAQHMAAQVAANESHQLELLQQWQQQQQASQVYLQVLQQVLDSLMELIQDHLLGKQQAANEVQRTWLSAHTHTLLLKLKVIEEQLLVLTYNSDTMPALRKVDDHLARAQRKLDARDEQASVRLYHFDQLGPDFLELASQYRDLQEDLDHANFTLCEFQKAAADEL